jgi:hypothetical protein
MDPAILMSAVSTTAATTLVAAMSTDVWQGVREVLARAFAGDQGTKLIQQLDASARELETTAEEDASEVEARIVAEVAGRFRMLTDGSPEATGRLAHVVAEVIVQTAVRMSPPVLAGELHAIARDSAQQAVQFSGQQNNTFKS